MARKRIYEIAHELGVSSKDLISKLEEMGMTGMKAANSVEEEEYSLIVHLYREPATATAASTLSAKKEAPVAEELPKTAAVPATAPRKPGSHGPRHGTPRPPVVSVLGHIDHGKTTLLDAIRHSHLAAKEAGGITQGVAAYQADLHGRRITFIDTPGHKAFTGMRARGASATDIAILVVAADDGVMTQTVEAIDHIKAAGIPMIVAINKVDKTNADVNKVMGDLAQHGLTPEAWGGDTITVEISALQGTNVEDLLEMILLVAEMEDLRADPNGDLEAVIIESHLSPGRGPVATVIVRDGTLREKDWAVAGSTYGRVKALLDETSRRVAEARPGDAVQVLGFDEVPAVGARIVVAKDQAAAKRAVESAKEEKKPQRARRVMTFDELLEEAEEKVRLQLILKAASTGALEAARRELETLKIEGVELSIIHAGVGAISESDVLLAMSVQNESVVVGFGVKPDGKAARAAEEHGILVLTYDIIYDLVDEMERALKRKLAPEFEEIVSGSIEVRNVFKIPTGKVAGCFVADGKVTRKSHVRVLRGDQEVFVGEIASLRRFEDDVREVLMGRECGIHIKDFDDVQVGDRLVAFDLKEVER
ncbi:MAG: translation initiation factor IF-2 [Candidatus Bipolaricaulota bacterium]|nr:translation initiation factor IF-2 [Candidatus Bipolaricaulota bacterium]